MLSPRYGGSLGKKREHTSTDLSLSSDRIIGDSDPQLKRASHVLKYNLSVIKPHKCTLLIYASSEESASIFHEMVHIPLWYMMGNMLVAS